MSFSLVGVGLVASDTFSTAPPTAVTSYADTSSYQYGAGGARTLTYAGQTYAGTFTSGSGFYHSHSNDYWFSGTFTLDDYSGQGGLDVEEMPRGLEGIGLGFFGTPLSATPEPGSASLAGAGLLAMALLGLGLRRRRAAGSPAAASPGRL